VLAELRLGDMFSPALCMLASSGTAEALLRSAPDCSGARCDSVVCSVVLLARVTACSGAGEVELLVPWSFATAESLSFAGAAPGPAALNCAESLHSAMPAAACCTPSSCSVAALCARSAASLSGIAAPDSASSAGSVDRLSAALTALLLTCGRGAMRASAAVCGCERRRSRGDGAGPRPKPPKPSKSSAMTRVDGNAPELRTELRSDARRASLRRPLRAASFVIARTR
jgi:hypothetical protein